MIFNLYVGSGVERGRSKIFGRYIGNTSHKLEKIQHSLLVGVHKNITDVVLLEA